MAHYKAQVEDIDLHFIHQRSENPDAIPIILLHGWPGSFHEFHACIGPLTNPTAHGRTGPGINETCAMARVCTCNLIPPPITTTDFHVVIPSLPGYVFSSASTRKSPWTMQDNARVMDKLMVGLGYDRYAAQGCLVPFLSSSFKPSLTS